MHSLNLKVASDFNALLLAGRVRSSMRGYNWRVNRIVACSNPGGSGPVQDPSHSSNLSRTEMYALLKQQLEVAAKSEVPFLFWRKKIIIIIFFKLLQFFIYFLTSLLEIIHLFSCWIR